MAALILASQSPRRQALLRAAGLDFRVIVPDIDEDAHQTEGHPGDLAKRTAAAKAEAVEMRVAQNPDLAFDAFLILAADTIVALGDEIFNKPLDADHARRMLRTLSGQTHTVHTGVTLIGSGGIQIMDTVPADVTFNDLSDAFIDRYVATGEPMDKAGSYGIQGLGAELVARVDGDITGVIGLPLTWIAKHVGEVTGRPLATKPLHEIALEAFPDLARLPESCLAGLR